MTQTKTRRPRRTYTDEFFILNTYQSIDITLQYILDNY